MSDVTPDILKNWTPGKIPGQISKKIHSLRGAMLRWLVIRGFAWLLGLILLTVAVDFCVDYLGHMDFPQRVVMAVLVLAVWCYGIYRFFILPLKKRPSDDALLLSVEQQLETKNNPLINSLQLARVEDHQSVGQSPEMAQHVIGLGVKEAEKLNFQKILNQSASGMHLVTVFLFLLAFGGIAFGVTSTLYGKLWFQRNVMFQDVKWPTSTVLTVQGVKDGVLVVPYGEDFRITAKVDEGSKVTDVDVYLHYLDQSGSSRQKFSNSDKTPLVHRTVMRSVKNEVRIQVSGGDFYSEPIQIRLVKPPGFESLSLRMTPPEYCKLPPRELALSKEAFSVLHGSKIEIAGLADKPGTKISLRSKEKAYQLQEASDAEGKKVVKVTLEGKDLVSGDYEFDLVDDQGVSSSKAVKFRLNVTADRAPVVRARIAGVTRKVVPKAMIPIAATIEDEFGVKNSWALLKWGPLGREPKNQVVLPTKLLEKQNEGRKLSGLEIVDLKPLGLSPGSVVRVRISGKDFQPDPSGYLMPVSKMEKEGEKAIDEKDAKKPVKHPGVGDGKDMDLQVVTESELRADLLRREMEQTKAFKRLIKQQQKVITDLKILRVASKAKSETDDAFVSRKQQAGNVSIRSQRQVDTLIVQAIDRFDAFLKEIHYNRLDEGIQEIAGAGSDQTLSSRISSRIVEPLQEINEKLMPKIQRNLELVSRNYSDQKALAESVDKVVPMQIEVVAKLEAVLAAMEQSQTFQEIVNQVIAMKLEEQKVREKAKKRKEEESGIGEIFK